MKTIKTKNMKEASAVLLFLVVFTTVVHPQPASKDCNTWKNIAAEIEEEPRLANASCQPNNMCTGVDCNAIYNVPMPGVQKYNICFGLFLNPCNKPVDVSVYLEVPSTNLSFYRNYSDDENTKIPGLRFNVEYAGVQVGIDGYLFTDLERYHDVLRIGMRFKGKGFLHIFGTEQERWFKSTEVELVPDVNVTTPSCSSQTQMPRHRSGTCPVNTDKMPINPHTDISSRSCDPNAWDSCRDYEKCMQVGGANLCACSTEAAYFPSQKRCISLSERGTPYDDNDGSGDGSGGKQADGKSKKTVGYAVGGLIAVAVVVGAVIAVVFYRRKRTSVMGSGRMQLRNELEEET